MHSTNVEFVTELMEFSAHGGLIQAFVIHALDQYSCKVAAAKPEDFDSALVSGNAWHGCAVELQAKLRQRFGPDDERQGGEAAHEQID